MNTAPLLNENNPNHVASSEGLMNLSIIRDSKSAYARGNRAYEFGPYRLDPAARLLLRGGERVPIPPKALDLLVELIKYRGRMVGKEELMQMIWPDTFVEQANLTVTISMVRKVLGERPDGGQYIETMPRRGYRFAASVREVSDDHSDSLHTDGPRTTHRCL